MIILNDLNIQTRSDMPNSDWTNGEAGYVVDDNSTLAKKIRRTRIQQIARLVDIPHIKQCKKIKMRYATDLTNKQWKIIGKIFESNKGQHLCATLSGNL